MATIYLLYAYINYKEMQYALWCRSNLPKCTWNVDCWAILTSTFAQKNRLFNLAGELQNQLLGNFMPGLCTGSDPECNRGWNLASSEPTESRMFQNLHSAAWWEECWVEVAWSCCRRGCGHNLVCWKPLTGFEVKWFDATLWMQRLPDIWHQSPVWWLSCLYFCDFCLKNTH